MLGILKYFMCYVCVRFINYIYKGFYENINAFLFQSLSLQKEKVKTKSNDTITKQKYMKFRQAMGLSGEEDASTE